MNIKDKKLNIDYRYHRSPATEVKEVRYYLRTKTKNDLPVSFLLNSELLDLPLTNQSGHISFSIPVSFLASGKYQVIAKTRALMEPEKKFLKSDNWTAMLKLKNYIGKDVEISTRVRLIEGNLGLWLLARAQKNLGVNSNQWKFYFLSGGARMNIGKSYQAPEWTTKRVYGSNSYSNDQWHKYIFRCIGNRIEGELDGKTIVEMTDPENMYKEGAVGIRMGYATCYFADISIKDLQTGKQIYKDNFEKEKLSDNWEVLKGDWKVTNGYLVTSEDLLGEITIPPPENVENPKVKLKPYGNARRLMINRKPFVPLFFSPGETEIAPFQDSTAELLANVHKSGVRLFVPFFYLSWDKSKGEPNFSALDDLMSELLLACPDGYFVLRLYMLPPPDMPESEKTIVARAPGDISTPKNAAGIGRFNASLASEHYRQYAQQFYKKIVSHMRAQSYGERVIGMLLAGAGYEGNWGQPNGHYGVYMDICPAQKKVFGNFLKNKYKTLKALREAWENPDVDFHNPPLPGLEDRTVSEAAGFRDSVKTGPSRWVSDFLDMYWDESLTTLVPLFDTVTKNDPDKFYGRFGGLATCNKAWAGIQLCSFYRYDLFDLSNPGINFLAGCLGYGDRLAGGTSIYTVQAWESARRHGKLVLGEADIRTYVAPGGDKTCAETISCMRREFAHTILIGQQAMWYYDMAFSGPWFEDRRLQHEMGREVRIGNAALPLKHHSVADALVIQDNHSLRYFATAPKQLKKGQDVRLCWGLYAHHQVHMNVEAMTRSGAQMDFIVPEDFAYQPKYKLTIFPTQFYCDSSMRRRIHDLLQQKGGVYFFFTGAGIVDEKGTKLKNMEQLLNIKVKYDGPCVLKAWSIKGTHPILRDLGAEVRLENGQTEWYRFYIEDNSAVPLARYADGKVAMAIKKYGKGFIVYSGIPVITPAIYRAVARFAGCHIYSNSDDALFADNQFVMIHTKAGGRKQISLPGKCQEVREVFAGRCTGHNTSKITELLPAKHTAVYYIGDNKEFLADIKRFSKYTSPDTAQIRRKNVPETSNPK